MKLPFINQASYHNEGFIVLSDVIPLRYVDNIVKEIDELLMHQYSLYFGGSYPGKDKAIVLLYNRNKNYRRVLHKWLSYKMLAPYDFISSSLVISICKSLGVHFPLFQMYGHCINLPGEDYFLTEWHQDIGIMDTENSVVFWFPLLDTTVANGAVALKKCSHLEGVIKPCKLNYRGHSELSDDILDKYDDILLEYSPGDLLVFNPMLIHNAMPNRTDKPRWASIFRFEDASDNKYLDLRSNPLHEGYIMKVDSSTTSGFKENSTDDSVTSAKRKNVVTKYNSL